MHWSPADIPDLTGTVAVVTGATSGLGLEVTRELAGAGAHVVLATRNADKTIDVMSRLRASDPAASLAHVPCDLSDLDSVRGAVSTLHDELDHIDVLVNNAGIMAPPRSYTAQGFELQLGVNHLGHMALTLGVLDLVTAADAGRVVTVSSAAHRMGTIHFDDLDAHRGYERWGRYGQSKLANLLFTLHLQRRLEAANERAIAVAAHPGWSATDLQGSAPAQGDGLMPRINALAGAVGNRLFAQDAARGAEPTVFAAVGEGVVGNSYWGPSGFKEMTGPVGPSGRTTAAMDPQTAQRLWRASQTLLHRGGWDVDAD